MIPHCRKLSREENRIENLGQEGYRSLGKMLQSPVRVTVWARSIVNPETADGFVNLVRVG
jgi:hypothetical protein